MNEEGDQEKVVSLKLREEFALLDSVISVTERSNKWRAEKDVRMESVNVSDKSSFTMQGALPLRVTASHCPDILYFY